MVNFRFKRLVTRSFSTSEVGRQQTNQNQPNQQQQQNGQQLKTSTLELTDQEKRVVSERFTGTDRLPDIGYIDEEISESSPSTTAKKGTNGYCGAGDDDSVDKAKDIASSSNKSTLLAAKTAHIDYFEESHIELGDLLLESKSGSVLLYSCQYSKRLRQRSIPRLALKVTFYDDVRYGAL